MSGAGHSFDDRGKKLADGGVAQARDEGHAAVDALRVEQLDELDGVRGRDGRAKLDLDWVGDQRGESDVGAVGLPGAIADPRLVGREEVEAISGGPQEGALVVEHEHLVTCVELDAAQ